jgi:lysophospholipase L1-like esterase
MPFTYAEPDWLRAFAGLVTPISGLSAYRQNTAPMRNILFLGDSIIEGHVSNTKGPVTSFREQLAISQPTLTQHGGFQPPWRTVERSPWIGAWSFAGTWSNSLSQLGPYAPSVIGGTNTPAASGAVPMATWTRPAALNVTEIDLYYVDVQIFGQGFSYSTDGATWVDVPPTSPAGPELRKVTITGLSNPANLRIRTLRADGVTSGSIMGLVGIVVRSGTTGVTIHNLGRAGSGFATAFGSLSYAATPRDWQAVVSAIDPDLTVVLFSNDDNPTLAPAVFTVMAEVATKLRAIGNDVVFVGQMDQDGRNVALEKQKNAQLRTLAVANGFGYVDLMQRWGTWQQAFAAGLMADNFHPTNKGGDRIAADLDLLLRVS